MQPIAIVGRACRLPGANSPAALAALVLEGRDTVTSAPPGRWRLPHEAVLGDGPDHTWTDRGGYVDAPGELDDWLLACSREALGDLPPVRTGAVFGNLSFPSESMAAWAERQALGLSPTDARAAFMSGLPAARVARELKLHAGAFCLDAACASSIFALKVACDRLGAGQADRMLAGAVNRADSLFLHIGFCALGAMSKSGRSRPFHREADGLLPAEGCVVLALERLEDAERRGARVYGVIRGVGLSNDGRARSLLAPSSEGQVRAMRLAFEGSGLSPADIQLLECHATGTPQGDRTEVESLAAVYPGGALGSLKSNLGHLITAAGAAGVLKVLAAMEAETLPPTLHAEDPIATGPFSLVDRARPWRADVRRAAVSAFGFGGNNGHLLLEQRASSAVSVPVARGAEPISIVGIGRWDGGPVELDLDGLRFPPADLRQALAQQAALLQAARDAAADFGGDLPRERTGVFVGLGCDLAVTAWGLRWRLPFLHPDGVALADRAAPPLRAEHVVGTMPNIPANRVSVQLDAGGPGLSVSAEELSGLRALELAIQALTSGELDVAIVGAVDAADDPRHRAALEAVGRDGANDAAVALVLTRGTAGYATISLADADGPPVARPARPAHAAEALQMVADAAEGAGGVVSVEALGGQRGGVGVRRLQKRRSSPVRRQPSSIPAHAAALQLGAALQVARGNGQAMPRAPRLPATTERRPEYAVHTHGTGGGPGVAAEAPAPAGAEGSLIAMVSAQRSAVARAHAAFLETQADAYRALVQRWGFGAFGQAAPGTNAEPASSAASATARASASASASDPAAAPTSASASAPASPTASRSPSIATPAPTAPAPRPPAGSLQPPASALPGPRLDRQALVTGASQSITTLFGPDFRPLDAFHRVVRMPTPPLLLCDRVLGIDGPAMKLGKGSIWTETDVKADGWYMHDGRMGGGVMIESGQADLLLISWQGIDLLNRSERVYRLLGCTLTYRGELPRAGETLRYDIHIDAHANLGPVRMFFFHYDCRVGDDLRLSVREGQAGFFTDAELADSGGILWTPEEHTPVAAEPPVATRASARRTFDRAALAAFAEGRAFECFGDGFARTASHTWTPRIAGGNLLFLDRVAWDPAGGPWGRGHLRAEQDIRPDTWFFDGHFHHDPCMPGTLMFEGCLQAMQLYLAAMGCTVDRDGWRFTPAPDVAYKLRCRGQVLPTSRLLVYELFVEELVLGPIPRLRAQVLCTVDGLKCFHADPLILELVPDWPLSRMAPPSPDGRPCVWDYASLLACAWGRPTDAFGPMYRAFDGPRKVPRLPGPPYHFMSRVVETTGEMGGARAPASVTVAYDVPPDAWYFAENGAPTMPYAVLLEAALQPCGWLASWVGCTLGTDEDLMFRNLDGTATQHREVSADSGTLTTRSRLTRLSKSAGMIIVGFQVETTDAAGPVFTMDTVFGFFPAAAFANQAGVGSTDQQRARLDQPGDGVRSPATPGLATGRLLMFDRVTVADGTYFRAEKDVIPGDWFFKAHFYQDPVQPGSLGIEAMIQLLQWAMVHRGLTAGMARPRFEPVALGEAMTWKYRGQVVPENRLITTEVDLTRVEGDTAWASASLWVDGKRIYDAKNLAMRVRDAGSSSSRIEVPVPGDHRPTWTLPALPMMSMAMLALAHGRSTELRAGQATRWLTFPDGPRSVDVAVSGQAVTLSAAGAVFFSATLAGDEPVPPVTALRDARPGFDGAELYASGRLFHGPRFQALQRVDAWGADGATATLHPDVPPDVLLDAATHAIPHDDMGQWWPEAPDGCAAYPRALRRLSLLGGPPTGPVRVEARFLGGEGRIARLSLHLLDGARLVAYVELDEILMPKGRVGRADPAARRAFLQGSFVPGLTLSDEGRLSPMDVAATDWLPGTVEAVFGTRDAAEIAAKEVVGQALGLHPRRVVVTGDLAGDPARPLTRHRVTRQDGRTTSEPARLAPVFDWWRARLDSGPWPGEGILSRLADAFLGELVLHAPLPTSPCLFLANHETYLESVLFCIVVSALGGRPVRALAKTEHREAWLGGLHELLVSYPGREQPAMIVYFDQSDPASLPVLVRDACAERSLLVHVEGTRQERSGQPVERISSLWIDLGVPIVPVAFRGGADGRKRDVPPGRQDVHIGPVLMPAELAALPYAARAKAVREAINALPSRAAVVEQPEAAPREAIDRAVGPALADADAGWVARWRAWVAG